MTEICLENVIHQERVDHALKHQLSQKDLALHLTIYKAVADPTRLRLLWALIDQELCVCDLAYLLQMTKSAVSHQLRYLFDAKLINRRKQGRMVFYALKDQHVHDLLQLTHDHIHEEDIHD